jgi:mersacidin/lichenicidin family type 2 lantibiotic
MSNIDIIRAWKDVEYRASLSETELAQLPENPAGPVELSNTDMVQVAVATMLADFTCNYLCREN